MCIICVHIHVYYRSVPDKRPLLGKRLCTTFQGATIAASIQMYGIYVPGKCPCGPKLQVMFKHPWALTRDTTVILCTYVIIIMSLTIITCITGVVSGGLALAVESQARSSPSRQRGLLVINSVLHDLDKYPHNSIIDSDLSVHIANKGPVTY